MATFSTNFRRSVKGNDHPGSIYFRFIHRRRVATVTTPYKIYPFEWDPLNRKIIYHSALPRPEYLIQLEKNLARDILFISRIIERLDMNGDYTVVDILSQYRQRDSAVFLAPYARKLASELDKRGQERTAEAYRSAVRAIIRYNNGKDIPLERMNTSLIKGFEYYLRESSKSLNTISFYMRNLRAIYNRAIQGKCIDVCVENPFSSVYTGVQVTRKRALTKEEMNVLLNWEACFANGETITVPVRQRHRKPASDDTRLHFALDLFFFCFHARGMSFVDMAYLKKTDIRDGIISYRRRKTGQMIEVKVTAPMQTIIDKYARETEGILYLFPIIRDRNKSARLQYMSALRLQNMRLKKIKGLCGIWKKLTTHVSRHSWATIAKKENLPLWVISEGLGHSNEKMTYTYLASFEQSVIDKANETVFAAIREPG